MKKKIIDRDMPMGRMIRIKDFLPPPNKLAVSQETEKITIALSKSSVEFFKHAAQRYHTKYQKMIRQLVDRYVMQYPMAK